MRKTLRAGVIGVGSLGRYHAQKYAALEGVELAGVADIDASRARAVAAEVGCRAMADCRDLLAGLDIASVVVPTEAHYEVAKTCLEAGVHVLVEKPIARTLEEADALIALAARRGLKLAVGHLERFNPAFVDLYGMLDRPFFMEAERLGGFKGRATDVDVVLDLMIHDIDLMLAMMPAKVASVSACGFQVLTDHVDIANARFEFEDGAVADLSASRVSRSPVRKFRVFGTNFYASADLQLPELRVERRPGPAGPEGTARAYEKPDALKTEIEAFVATVRGEPARVVTGREGRDALALALEVNDGIVSRLERLAKRRRVTLAIAPLADEEVEALCELARASWRHHYPPIIGTAQTEYMLAQRYVPALIREELSRGIWWDTLADDGALLAFASSFPWEVAGTVKLDKLYVHPGRQRLGYGGALLEHTCERARRLGFAKVLLAVNKRNVNAIGAYRKHGFDISEAVVKDIGEGFVMDDYIMEKAL